MNKKILCITLGVVFSLTALSAQNLRDNDYQKAGRAYEKQAKEAMDQGRYDEAGEFADLATIEYRKSREYADALLLKFRAANAINLVQRTITDVSAVKTTAEHYAAEITGAKKMLAEARILFDAENWIDSRSTALEALELLKDIRRVKDEPRQKTSSTRMLPRYYTVVGRTTNTDCFWNISGRDGVYGDPSLWKNLWKENLDAMKDPNNPDLIFPGMIIEIPSVNGETREGSYDPTRDYSSLN